MKARILVVIAVAGIIFSVIGKVIPNTLYNDTQVAVAAPVDEAMKAQILNATVRIRISTPGSGTSSGGSGLATLVEHNGQLVLVTHDHWDLEDTVVGLVHFRSANSELLADLMIDEFRALIRYRDNGTMLLDLPERFKLDLVTPVSYEAVTAPSAGETVYVVHQDTTVESSNKSQVHLEVSSATVQDISTKESLPVFILKNSNGHKVIPGDSGGGIWYQGQLVGNMWTALMVQVDSVAGSAPQPTTSGIAAQVSLSS